MPEARPVSRTLDRAEHELLVVDDNPASRYATVRQLGAAGFRVREAATGGEALERLGGISAMVLDVQLPDVDGIELLGALRAREDTARLPVLLLTAAYVTDDDKVRGLDSGADAYLTRPVEPAVIVATVQSLVRTRLAEDAARRSEAKWRAVYERAPGGIGLLDADGRLVDANPALRQLLGRGAEQVIGRPLVDFVEPARAAELDAFVRPGGEDGTGREAAVLRPDGTAVSAEWAVTHEVEPGVTMVVAIDVSQRVQLARERQQILDRERIARGEAEQVSRMKDDFIAVLSHELRTPLNAIMGWVHVLNKRGGSDEQMRGFAAIERNGTTQARMIADLLDMSRLNLGKLPLVFDTIDAVAEIASAVHALGPSFEEKSIAVDLQLGGPFRPLRADAARLQQVVWNLVSNAVKFSSAGGRIVVALDEDGERLRLRVSDEGQGIAPEFLPFVFERFAQSDAASNRQRGGLGLGLAIVKQLVEAHGGSIVARSAGLGRGATFEARLPWNADHAGVDADTTSTPQAPVPEGDAAETTLAGTRLVIVDDDPDALAMLRIILADRGATVRAASDVQGALALLEAERPDVLVSDIGMRGQDGYDLIRAWRGREAARGAPRLPAIALTSFTREQDRAQALAAGFDRHCGKPLRPLALVQQIRQALDAR